MSAPRPKHSIMESIGHPARGTSVVQVLDLELYDENENLPLVQLITDLQKALENIPEEFRDSAVLNIRSTGEYASANADVTFIRPETDEELTDRRRWLAGLDEEREARDQREFERLKRKYTDSARIEQ